MNVVSMMSSPASGSRVPFVRGVDQPGGLAADVDANASGPGRPRTVRTRSLAAFERGSAALAADSRCAVGRARPGSAELGPGAVSGDQGQVACAGYGLGAVGRAELAQNVGYVLF